MSYQEDMIALIAHNHQYMLARPDLFPARYIMGFLGPSFEPLDHSCRAAVARLIAHRVSRGQAPCSLRRLDGLLPGSKSRLCREEFFSRTWPVRPGRALEKSVDPQWLWKSRRVYVYDGSSVSMPYTVENQPRLSAT